MPDSLPRTFTGWEIEALDRESDLDRSDEANGKLYGKYIQWNLTNYDRGNGNRIVAGWTVFSGEDITGRLVFSGVDRDVFCNTYPDIPIVNIRVKTGLTQNQGGLKGLIELQPDEFGPSTTYKIGLSIRAKVIPGTRIDEGNCLDIKPTESLTPCVLVIKTNAIKDGLGNNVGLGIAFAPEISGYIDTEFDVSLDVSTDAIDFNSLYPGQAVQVWFALAGRQMTLERVTLSKIEF
jgi:hypothetical protein